MFNKVIIAAALCACVNWVNKPCYAGKNIPVAFGGGMYCNSFLTIENGADSFEKSITESYYIGYFSATVTSFNMVKFNSNENSAQAGSTLHLDDNKFRIFVISSLMHSCSEHVNDQMINAVLRVYSEMLSKRI